MEIKCVIEWFDIPRIEAPSTARAWIEANFDPLQFSSGFGLTGTSCSADVRDPGAMMYDVTPFSSFQALDLLLDKIDNCELFLVHDLGSEPVLPLAILDSETNTYVINQLSLGLIALENAEQALKQALRNHGALAPAPTLPVRERAPEPARSEPARQTSGVALLPVRYAVNRHEYREELYSYDSPNLGYDLPELTRATYVLRTLRSGFVYVYYNDSLDRFSVGTTRLKPDRGNNSGNIKANGDALIFPGDGAGEEVYIAFSEHEWTDAQCRRIIDNEGGCRDSQMQRYSLESPQQDAFPLAELASQVEEYAGVDSYSWWSDYPSHGRHRADARIAKLESAAGAQYVVALHDPIAITHDLTSLVEELLRRIKDYATQNHRRKIIADTIDTLYSKVKDPGDLSDFSEHVRESERVTFLREYKDTIDAFQKILIEYKKDRYAWLSTAASTDRPGTLGSAWMTYDLASTRDWYDFEFSFARSVGDLITIAMSSDELRNEREFALLDQWVSERDSWLFKAMAPPDVMNNISSNWGLLGKVSSSSVSFVKGIHRDARATSATQALTKILTGYALKTGAAMRRGKLAPDHIKKMTGMPDPLTLAFEVIGARHNFIIEVKDNEIESVLHKLEEASHSEGLVEGYVKAPNHRPLDDVIPLFELTDADDVYRGSKHPFHAATNTAGSGIIAAFSLLNLASASEALIKDVTGPSHDAALENQLSLIGAIVGLGEVAAGTLKAVDSAVPAMASGGVASKVVRKLASEGASEAFAIIGLGFDLGVAGTKAYKQFGEGESDAAQLYAASGLTSMAGFGGVGIAGTVLSGGTALIAILVIAVVSAVLSTIFDIWGDSERAGPVERWLDSCAWGKRKMENAITYRSVKEEQEGLFRLIHEPVVIDTDFSINPGGFENYLAEFKIFLPNYNDESYYKLTDEDEEQVYAKGSSEKKEHGVLFSYRHFIRKSSHKKHSMKYSAVYAPNHAFEKKPIVKEFTLKGLW